MNGCYCRIFYRFGGEKNACTCSYDSGKTGESRRGNSLFKEQTLVNAKKVKGFKQAFMMVNRQNGKIIAMVHWENQQAIEDSMPIASKAIPKMKELSGATQDAMFDIYEVAVADVPVATGKK